MQISFSLVLFVIGAVAVVYAIGYLIFWFVRNVAGDSHHVAGTNEVESDD